MNLSKVCVILAIILPLVALEKKALENHIDDEPVDNEKAKELKRRKSSDLKIKKELEARAKAKALKTTTETEINNPTTNAPSTTEIIPEPSDLPYRPISTKGCEDVKEKNCRQELRDFLLGKYPSVNIHPVYNHSEPVRVDLGMALIHLDLDEKVSVLEVDGWMRLNWTDQYLVWDPTQHGGLKQIHFGQSEIWKPDIQLYNNADSANMQHFGTTHFLVFNTGVVLWVPPAKFRAFCKVDLRQWPHDSQSCKLKFGSWTSHGDQIDLGLYHDMDTVDKLNFYTENKEWKVESSTATRSENKYETVAETYPDVTFTFQISRRSPSYRAAIILPCLLTMLLVVTSFLLPPTAGEKITLNSICFLVCCLYMIYFQSSLPAMADHMPLILLFYSNTAALVAIAILLNVCCISMARERRYSSPPKALRTLFSGFLGRLLCLGSYYHQVSETHHRLELQLDDVSMSESPESEQAARELNLRDGQETNSVMRDWLLVAAGIERFFLMVYALAFGLVSSVYL